VLFISDKGVLRCGEYGDGPQLLPYSRNKEYKRPEKTIARVHGGHEQNWIDACKVKLPARKGFGLDEV